MKTGPDLSASEAGFTLIELLVCVAIIALTASVAVPLLSRPPSPAQVKADATRLAAALRVTRAAAMARNQEMVFLIDAGQRSYASPVIEASPIAGGTTIDMALSEAERRSGAVGGIRFFPSGRSSGADIRLQLSQAAARVRVSWATGHVRLDL